MAKSKEVTNAFEMLAAFVLLRFLIEYMGTVFVGNMSDVYSRIPEYAKLYEGHVQVQTFRMLFASSLIRILQIISPFLLVGFLVAFITNVLQVKWKITGKPLQPKFNKLNPVSGFKRVFSKNSLMELVKSILKLTLIGYVVYDYLKKTCRRSISYTMCP